METEQKMSPKPQEPERRAEYDFPGGQRGRHAHFPKMTRAVVLAPDVAAVFPDADAVNTALRLLAKTARQSVKAEPGQEQEAA